MAKSAGQGYKSNINLNLSQLPTSTDPALFNALIEVHNALHILNAGLDSITNNIFGGNKDMAPDESMRFIRTIWVPANEPITIGSCVRWSGDDNTQVRKGQATSTTGFALSEATEEGDLVQVGFGPAIIKLDGAPAGKYYHTTNDDPVRGQLLDTGFGDSCIIGRAFTTNYILFCPGWYNPK